MVGGGAGEGRGRGVSHLMDNLSDMISSSHLVYHYQLTFIMFALIFISVRPAYATHAYLITGTAAFWFLVAGADLDLSSLLYLNACIAASHHLDLIKCLFVCSSFT